MGKAVPQHRGANLWHFQNRLQTAESAVDAVAIPGIAFRIAEELSFGPLFRESVYDFHGIVRNVDHSRLLAALALGDRQNEAAAIQVLQFKSNDLFRPSACRHHESQIVL